MRPLRPRHISLLQLCAIAVLTLAAPAFAAVSEADKKSGVVECSDAVLKDHNPGLAADDDRLICFTGYVSNFNTQSRETKPKYLGVPHWVAHHVKKSTNAGPESGERPGAWFTIFDLADKGIAPISDSYAFSSAFRNKHKNWYDRGHLAQKYLAERLGNEAALYTHNVVNAVPQLHVFNAGPWLTLECMTGAWANKYGEVWIVAGPIFEKNKKITWMRSDNHKKAVPVAIPPKEFKIVARKNGAQWNVLSFVYPQNHKTYAKGPFDPAIWFKPVAEIERMTGLKFFAGLANGEALKTDEAEKLWPVAKSDFDSGCKKQAADVQ